MAKKIIIEITTGHAAFGDDDWEESIELAQVLQRLKTAAERNQLHLVTVKDSNGNTVGNIKILEA